MNPERSVTNDSHACVDDDKRDIGWAL
jgi:hypothetical protein